MIRTAAIEKGCYRERQLPREAAIEKGLYRNSPLLNNASIDHHYSSEKLLSSPIVLRKNPAFKTLLPRALNKQRGTNSVDHKTTPFPRAPSSVQRPAPEADEAVWVHPRDHERHNATSIGYPTSLNPRGANDDGLEILDVRRVRTSTQARLYCPPCPKSRIAS